MALFDDVLVGLGLKKRKSADYSELKNKLDSRIGESEARRNKAFGTAGSVYDNANNQRDFVARKSLKKQIGNLRGLNPNFAELLKANLTQRLAASQQLRRQQAVSSLGLDIQNKQDETTKGLQNTQLGLQKGEIDDARAASAEQGSKLSGLVKEGISAYATSGASVAKAKPKNKKLK